MRVRFGIQKTASDLVVQLGEEDTVKSVEAAISKAFKNEGLLWLTDAKGRRIAVNLEDLAFVEITGADEETKIGFS